MSNLSIKVENLSKLYRLGSIGTGTLSHDLNRYWHKLRGMEDPYLKIGESNDRTSKGKSDYVWALKDVNFEVREGDVLGIVGKNGAGKSTLLKILSQITKPSHGSIKMKGRVGALLEVGTGFHPDLTGRENIYINGAILGMKRWEINKRIDEIISFAGIERYIDTPVKRYSSGMMVRLGFSVAAHLEPEILIVDEVLAVGDLDFQKKCLGKMDSISKDKGRTILFVSHNLNAISQLAEKGILLERGSVVKTGAIKDIIGEYLHAEANANLDVNLMVRKGVQEVSIKEVHLSKFTYEIFEDISIFLSLKVANPIQGVNIGFSIHNSSFETIFQVYSQETHVQFSFEKKEHHLKITLPKVNLAVGSYFIRMRIEANGIEQDWPQDPIAKFEVLNSNSSYSFQNELINKIILLPKYEEIH